LSIAVTSGIEIEAVASFNIGLKQKKIHSFNINLCSLTKQYGGFFSGQLVFIHGEEYIKEKTNNFNAFTYLESSNQRR